MDGQKEEEENEKEWNQKSSVEEEKNEHSSNRIKIKSSYTHIASRYNVTSLKRL